MYVVDFCVLSLIYLSVTACFYARQKKLPSLRNRLYGLLLVWGLAGLALDIFVALIDPVAYRFAAWFVYAANMLFLLITQASAVTFFFYTLAISGRYPRTLGRRLLLLAPFFLAAVLLLLSPLLRAWGAFYLDAAHAYRHGAAHLLLYVTAAVYLVGSACVVFAAKRTIQHRKRVTIYSFLAMTILAMLVQLTHPYLLVNSTATALALTLIYHMLQSPSEHIDAQTGVFNRAALPLLLRDLYEQKQRCGAILFPLKDLGLVNYTVGMRNGDLVLREFAHYLERAFPGQSVVRVSGDVFAVLETSDTPLDEARLKAIRRDVPGLWHADRLPVAMRCAVAGVNSEDCPDAAALQDVVQKVLQLHTANREPDLLFCDAAFRESMARRNAMEEALMRALDTDDVQVYYQPIHNAEGKLVALEALARIQDAALGFIPPDDFVRMAEENGSIARLGEQVLRKVCAFIRDFDLQEWGLAHIGVNLSAIQCMQEELPEQIARVTLEYDIVPGLIAFEVTETAAAGSIPQIRRNMLRLSADGYSFLLDDFGTGYASFSYIAGLPFSTVKVDKHLLWEAVADPAKLALLMSMNNLFRRLGLHCVCEGVETAEQAAMVAGMGIGMQQGFYYSRALPPDEMLAYAIQRRRA